VIDDEEMILGVVSSILNTLGYECASHLPARPR
jgi:hypothetical protein